MLSIIVLTGSDVVARFASISTNYLPLAKCQLIICFSKDIIVCAALFTYVANATVNANNKTNRAKLIDEHGHDERTKKQKIL